MSNDNALGQRLTWPDLVMIRMNDHPAGVGMTPSGLWIEHTERLPAIFGEVIAMGSYAEAAGFEIGMFVLFVRYSGEITDAYEDGSNFAVFNCRDILAEVKREALIFSEVEMEKLNLRPNFNIPAALPQ